jgi:hypothetical protein
MFDKKAFTIMQMCKENEFFCYNVVMKKTYGWCCKIIGEMS